MSDKDAYGFLVVEITYNEKSGKFKLGGDVKKEKITELVECFLSTQMGQGEDLSEPKEPDKKGNYYIQLEWHPEDDSFTVSDTCGNKGLRDGILLHMLKEN